MKLHGEIKHKWTDTKDIEYNTYNLARRGGARMLQRRHWTVVQLCQGPEMQLGFAWQFGFWFRGLVILEHLIKFWGPETKACFLVWRNTCRISASVFAGKHRHWHRRADLRRGQLHRDLSACWQTMPIAVELSCKYSHTVCANVLGTTLGLQTGPYRKTLVT